MTKLNHVALLTPDVRKAANKLEKLGLKIGQEEVWDGEGTREIYVGDHTHTGLLLLMEPIREGAYQRALLKRGPGLHHLAIDVLSLEELILGLGGSGWLLHPQSIKTMKATQTAYLARPGIPTLIEVQERDRLNEKPLFVSCIELSISQEQKSMFAALGLEDRVARSSSVTFLKIANHRLSVEELLSS